MQRDIFISYSRKDLDAVRRIKTEIESATGKECWMDLNGIESGSVQFAKDIIAGIKDCKVFLFMLTEFSQASDFALRELNFAYSKARDYDKKVVMVNITGCGMSDEFSFMYGLADTITWNNPPQHDKLIRDLKRWLGDNKSAESDAWHMAEEKAREEEEAKRRAEEEARTTLDRKTPTESLEDPANGYVPPITDYSLIRSLGMGGVGEVWYAENDMGNVAAVKILSGMLNSPKVVDRFRNAAMVTSKLRHPNIQKVYEYSILNGHPCVVADYLEGEDLKAHMGRGVPFTDEQLRKWWNQLVSALNYMHGHGVVHLNIKPSNIFLTSKGNVKVMLDICNSRIEEEHTCPIGTLMYMSPEQIKGAVYLDGRSDSYSLAVTFVQLLSGRRRPYDSDSDVRKQIEEQPLDMTGVPAAWQRFLKPYLAKNPAARPALVPFPQG